MKLQCEVSVVGKRHELHVPGNRMAVDDAAVEHDAMAAHALLQAMDQALTEFTDEMPDEMWELLRNDRDALVYAFQASVRSTKAEIKQRAAEILAGWLGEDRG